MSMKERIQSLLEQVSDMKAGNAEELESLRIKYLSKKGEITELFNEFLHFKDIYTSLMESVCHFDKEK